MDLYFMTPPSEPVLSLKYAADFLKEASAYCSKMSKTMVAKNTDQQTFDIGFGKRYTLTFSCE